MTIEASHISPYRPGDEVDILSLYNDIYPENMCLDFWRWQYLSNPAGEPLIKLMWGEGRKLIGHYSLIPVRLYASGEYIYGALSGTAITHFDYRYRGVFGMIGDVLYQRARESGVRLIYGFPTSHNRQGLSSRLGWNITDINILFCWDAPNRVNKDLGFRLKEIKKFNRDFDSLWNKLSSGPYRHSTMVVRDSAYMQWRFMEQPGAHYYAFVAENNSQSLGYIILKKNIRPWDATGDIADIAALDTTVFRALVQHSFYFFRDIGCARMLLPGHSPYYQAALSMGFKESNISMCFGWRDLLSLKCNDKTCWEFGLGETWE